MKYKEYMKCLSRWVTKLHFFSLKFILWGMGRRFVNRKSACPHSYLTISLQKVFAAFPGAPRAPFSLRGIFVRLCPFRSLWRVFRPSRGRSGYAPNAGGRPDGRPPAAFSFFFVVCFAGCGLFFFRIPLPFFLLAFLCSAHI